MNVLRDVNGWKRTVTSALAIGVGLLAAADPAWAGHRRPLPTKHRISVWIPAVYETRTRTFAIPAVYESRTRKVWHDPAYEIRRVRVVIPAEIEIERVPRYGRRGRLLGYELVERVVRPARKVWKTRRVLVEKGYWETVVERVCVDPASTEIVHEKVLVRPGHWSKPRRRASYMVERYHHVVRRHSAGPHQGFDLHFALSLDR